MKKGARRWARASLLLSVLFVGAACGSSGSSSASLSSGGGSGGTGITSTFDSPSEMGVGDIMPIEFSGSETVTIDFAGTSSSANFILAVGSASTSGSGTTMQMTMSDVSPLAGELAKDVGVELEGKSEDDGYGPQEILSAWLRASEDVLPETEVPVARPALSESVSWKAIGVGETESFRVLGSLSSTTSYVDVTAEVRCVGSNVIFYVDTAVSSDVLPAADVTTLCQEFDSVAGAEQTLLGEISDLDNNGKLKVVMTKQINRLGALGGGIITGYFYAADLYVRSESNPVSNYGEVIYTMVPDPNGQYGTTISRDFAMSNLLPAVLPHELQHAISYNQHVFVNGGSPEENWLNEGMSHLVEDVMGYGNENPSRYAMYLSSPSTYGVVTQGSPNLMERGGVYLFLRFLYEQASDGNAFMRALSDTSLRGVANLEAAFGGSQDFNEFSEFLARWVVALAMTDRGISQDTRYTYRARSQHATGNYQGVCLSCDADDNRGTVLSGVHLNAYYGNHTPSIDASTAMFYEVTTLPNRMSLTGTQGGGNFGILIRTL